MSKRTQIQMSAAEQRAYLAAAQTVILNSIGPDGVPHPMPMWFAVEEDGAIAMTTFSKSQKIRNIMRDPRVSLLVESGASYAELRGLVLYGRAELVRELEAVKDILVGVSMRSIPEGGAADAESIRAAVAGTAPKRTGIRVRPQRIISWDHRKLGGKY